MNGSAPNEANNQAQLSLSVLGYWKAEPEDLGNCIFILKCITQSTVLYIKLIKYLYLMFFFTDDTLLETAFTDFKIFITQCLRGDELCAHYVLMNILSSV